MKISAADNSNNDTMCVCVCESLHIAHNFLQFTCIQFQEVFLVWLRNYK